MCERRSQQYFQPNFGCQYQSCFPFHNGRKNHHHFHRHHPHRQEQFWNEPACKFSYPRGHFHHFYRGSPSFCGKMGFPTNKNQFWPPNETCCQQSTFNFPTQFERNHHHPQFKSCPRFYQPRPSEEHVHHRHYRRSPELRQFNGPHKVQHTHHHKFPQYRPCPLFKKHLHGKECIDHRHLRQSFPIIKQLVGPQKFIECYQQFPSCKPLRHFPKFSNQGQSIKNHQCKQRNSQFRSLRHFTVDRCYQDQQCLPFTRFRLSKCGRCRLNCRFRKNRWVKCNANKSNSSSRMLRRGFQNRFGRFPIRNHRHHYRVHHIHYYYRPHW